MLRVAFELKIFDVNGNKEELIVTYKPYAYDMENINEEDFLSWVEDNNAEMFGEFVDGLAYDFSKSEEN